MRKRRLLIYLAPAMMDMVVAQFFFVNAVRLARMESSASVVSGVVTVWGLMYLICCPLVGKVLTVANSTRLILMACFAMAGVSLLHLLFPSMVGIYVLMACAGVATALFFPAFQVFMKAVDAAQASTVAYSTGMYTFAWSMGFAVGPFVAGFLLALQQPDGAGTADLALLGALWRTGLVYGLAELLEGYYLTPKILGESLGLHPVVVLVSIFAGGAAFGMFGILLALPVCASLVILLRVFVLPPLARFADGD